MVRDPRDTSPPTSEGATERPEERADHGRESDPKPLRQITALDASDPPEAMVAIEEASALEDARGVIRSGKLAGKSMWTAIWILALPVLLQQAMAAMVGMVDKLLAGNLPEGVVVPSMDAIGVGAYVVWFIGIAMSGLGLGGQAIIARAMGRGDVREAHETLGQSLMISVIWGALVGVGMWLLAEPLARFCRLSPEAIVHCRNYVGIIALSMPFCGVMMVGSMCMHGAGETTRPSVIAMAVNVVNLVFSWALSGVDLRFGEVTVVNPLPIDPTRFGVAGIAGGTALGYLFGALATLWVLRRGVKDLRLESRLLIPERFMVWRVVRIGVPNFLEGVALWGANLFVMFFIGLAGAMRGDGEVGEGLIGAHMIAVQWEAFSFLPGFAMGIAAGAIAGQYLGAGSPELARRAIAACSLVAMIFMGCAGFLFMFVGEFLTRLISDSPVYLEHTPDLLLICGAVQIFFALGIVTRQGLRGVGDVTWTLVITVVTSFFVRLPLAWFLGVHMGYGLQGIWLGLCIEIVIRGLAFGGRFLSSAWERAKV